MHDTASKLYNELLETYFDEYYYLSHAKSKKKMYSKWILTPNKLLTRLPILLTQVKTGNSSNKLKNEIRQIISFVLAY